MWTVKSGRTRAPFFVAEDKPKTPRKSPAKTSGKTPSQRAAQEKLTTQALKILQKKNKTLTDWFKLLALAGAAIGATVFGLGGRSEAPAATTPAVAVSKGARLSCRLEQVLDGDTVRAQCGGQTVKIRLDGIDAPESKQLPWGSRAREALQTLLRGERFELESKGADYYNRTLGTLYVGSKNINLTLVQQGQAVAYDFAKSCSRKKKPSIYCEAHEEAQRRGIGLWSEPGDQQDPKKWRKANL